MVMSSQVIRQITVAAALGCVAVLVTGCGGPTASSSSGGPAASGRATSSPGTTLTPAPGPGAASAGSTVAPAGARLGACPAPSLRITIGSPGGAGAGQAAGHSYETVDFINVSGRSCDLYGYPGVSFASQAGATIGRPAQRSGGAAVNVIVAPGGTAHAWLNVADATAYPAAKCHVVTARRLRVFPPGQAAASYVTLAAGEPACSSGAETTMVVYPVRSGTGTPGQLP
jgi:hypothetical protein